MRHRVVAQLERSTCGSRISSLATFRRPLGVPPHALQNQETLPGFGGKAGPPYGPSAAWLSTASRIMSRCGGTITSAWRWKLTM